MFVPVYGLRTTLKLNMHPERKIKIVSRLAPRIICIIFSALTYGSYTKNTSNGYWLSSLIQQLECCTAFSSFPGFFKQIDLLIMNIKSLVKRRLHKERLFGAGLMPLTNTSVESCNRVIRPDTGCEPTRPRRDHSTILFNTVIADVGNIC